MTKAFVVTRMDDFDDDCFEYIVGVCKTQEIAEAYKDSLEHEYDTEITEERWLEMIHELNNYEDEHDMCFDSTVEGLAQLFPEYPISELDKAEYQYDMYNNSAIYRIKEINFYESLEELCN